MQTHSRREQSCGGLEVRLLEATPIRWGVFRDGTLMFEGGHLECEDYLDFLENCGALCLPKGSSDDDDEPTGLKRAEGPDGDRDAGAACHARPKHLEVGDGQTGITYDSLFLPYLRGASRVLLIDPYIRKFYQAIHLTEFLETARRATATEECVRVHLQTSTAPDAPESQLGWFEQIAENSREYGVLFTFSFNMQVHDRSVLTDAGWKILLGRGLDIYQHHNVKDVFQMATRCQELRKCKPFSATFMRRDDVV